MQTKIQTVLKAAGLHGMTGGDASAPAIGIGGRSVSAAAPCYIIAEAGVNHNGSVDLAHRLVDAAHAAGADAVKFQTFRTDALARPDAGKAAYQQDTTGAGSQAGMLRRLELAPGDFAALKRHCDAVGIGFISTAFDPESLELVASLGPACLKWPSGEITSQALLRQAARHPLPVLLSTGMATLAEIDTAVATLRSGATTGICILQCVSNYPAAMADQNLRTIPALSAAFGCPAGFSDHTTGIAAACAARALGMAVLEKHFTLDATMDGPDHRMSLEPDALAGLVQAVRGVEAALGDGVKRPTPAEEDVRRVARKSLVYARALPKGHRIAESDLAERRPADGLPPAAAAMLAGRRLAQAVAEGARVDLGDFA
jgi:N-acetylneuraminate synthase/N,N'-diacetyllegionaminate synthase